jgi:hypothetical protein
VCDICELHDCFMCAKQSEICTTCKIGYFLSTSGVCLSCDPRCFKCTGPQ